jgi:UPF0755 protein
MRFLRTFALTLALGIVVAGAVLAGWFRHAVSVDRSYPRAALTVIVPNGSTGRAVAQLLEARGVIASALTYTALARLRGEQAAMKAGEFSFDPHRTTAEILQQVVNGGHQVAVWVTIPEGFTAKEIAQALAARDLGDEDDLESTFLGDSLVLLGSRTANLEGYLFPDTYLIPTAATPAEIAKILTDQFAAELPKDAASQAKRLGFTVPQIVTLASLVEREAKADDERPLMAGVYYNRLRLGMPLEVDATIEYTFAHHKDVITYADLARDSPYNTYLHEGLPPTPIANPGRASLRAAFHPQTSSYLYYVYMGNGHHAFSRTLAEHNANVARYLH